MSRDKRLQSATALVEQPVGPQDGTNEPIPDVCFVTDLARALRTSRRTIEKMRRANVLARVLGFDELPSIDKRPRWPGAKVRAFVASGRPLRRAS